MVDAAATEEVLLQDREQPFKGLFLEEQTTARQGAMLILPDLDRGPDEAAVARALRLHIPTQGWSTFSLELPGSSQPFTEDGYGRLIIACRRRIRLAFLHLLQRGYERIVLLGHGFGALMAVSWASVDKENLPEGIIALNLIPYHPPSGEVPLMEHLKKIKVPILDLYSGKSYQRVTRQAPARKRAGQLSGNPMYRQLQLEYADHDFNPYTPVLLRVVRNWLKSLPLEQQHYAPGATEDSPPPSVHAPAEAASIWRG